MLFVKQIFLSQTAFSIYIFVANPYFNFKQFTIRQDNAAMKVGTDGVLLGAYAACTPYTNVLDIGAGTGLISIMLAQKWDIIIDAIEIDPHACIDARLNIEKCPWANKITLHETSIQSFAINTRMTYQTIVSNPPFFSNSYKTENHSRNRARHNDSLSLDELFKTVYKLLKDEGEFYIIYPSEEFDSVCEIALSHKLYANSILHIKPTPQKASKRFIACFSKVKQALNERTIIIEDKGRHNYSDEYIKFTKEFYLNM